MVVHNLLFFFETRRDIETTSYLRIKKQFLLVDRSVLLLDNARVQKLNRNMKSYL